MNFMRFPPPKLEQIEGPDPVPGRIWKFVGLIHSGIMIAVCYAIDTLDDDVDREGEEALMAAAFVQVASSGPGQYIVPCLRRKFAVDAHVVNQHPMQGCPPREAMH